MLLKWLKRFWKFSTIKDFLAFMHEKRAVNIHHIGDTVNDEVYPVKDIEYFERDYFNGLSSDYDERIFTK